MYGDFVLVYVVSSADLSNFYNFIYVYIGN